MACAWWEEFNSEYMYSMRYLGGFILQYLRCLINIKLMHDVFNMSTEYKNTLLKCSSQFPGPMLKPYQFPVVIRSTRLALISMTQ